jgi:tRNA pseudouridine38-40 synthase
VIRLKLILAYQGTEFSGWQLQPASQGRTVQGCLEAALETLCGRPVRVHGSGRTDAGVHALGQVAHGDVPTDRSRIPWQAALNAILPPDISVLSAIPVDATFHARFSALAKTYSYALWHEPGFVLPQRRAFVWDVGRHGPPDPVLMDQAAAMLAGTHDFASFQNAGTPVSSTVRTIFNISRHPGVTPYETVWRFRADGFLKQMVRNLMGCLVAAGRGKVSSLNIRSLLTERERSLAPATAPASGLCLEHVEYEPDDYGDQRPLFYQSPPGQGGGRPCA